MEELTGRREDPGQLLIVTALALAVLLSLLSLTIHTAVLGEAHLAEATDSHRAERSAVQYQNAARRGIKGLLPAVSNRTAEYDAQQQYLVNGVENWSTLAGTEYARDGVSVSASVNAVSFKTTVIQNDSRKFTDKNSSTTWTVAENVSAVRWYAMNVTAGALVETDDCSGGNISCFELVVDAPSGKWLMAIHSTANTSITVTVRTGQGTDSCASSRSTALINVTNGTVSDGNTTCTFTPFDEVGGLDPPYTLRYLHANNVSGTYNLTVPERIVNGSIAADDRYGTSGSPRLEPRIAGAEAAIRYRSAVLTYRTEIRVTMGGRNG